MSLSYRLLEPGDLALYLSWINQRAIWEVDNTEPYVRLRASEVRPRFEGFVRAGRSYMLLLDGRAIGYLGFKATRLLSYKTGGRLKEAEFFIIIGDLKMQGKGYGGEALTWLFEHGFCGLGLDSIRARVLGNNSRAVRLYERLGFRYEMTAGPYFTRQGRRHGVLEYRLSREAWQGSCD